jgi:hypothetical protein
MLNTVLKVADLSLKSITFPPFTEYNHIQHYTVTQNLINFNSNHSASERRAITEEIKKCFEVGYTYEDNCRLATSEEQNKIKFLLKSWLLKIYPQQFLQKSIEGHYQIEFQLIYQKQIDEELLENTRKKFFYPNSYYFIKSKTSIEMINIYQNFPDEIFSFVDDENNHLKEIGHFFKNQVSQSWKQLK